MAEIQVEEVYLSHSGQEIDDSIDDVTAARGDAASLADALAEKLTAAQVYRGTKIEPNTDLNDLTTYGTYYCDSAAVATTLSNCPVSGSGFILQVYSTGNRIEYLYPVSASNSKFYWRCRTSNTWQQWFVVEGIPVT